MAIKNRVILAVCRFCHATTKMRIVIAGAGAHRSGQGPARMLETSGWSLTRVAERAGFGDISGLHRAFQKKLGVTPGDYRDRFGPAQSVL
jgi:methylphosphotriester-DNA--protein-cysteine methyltransferase